jgi:hypothetical protein
MRILFRLMEIHTPLMVLLMHPTLMLFKAGNMTFMELLLMCFRILG